MEHDMRWCLRGINRIGIPICILVAHHTAFAVTFSSCVSSTKALIFFIKNIVNRTTQSERFYKFQTSKRIREVQIGNKEVIQHECSP